MRTKSALVLTAFSALAAWATCADATIVIPNRVAQVGCLDGNGVLRPIGTVINVQEPVADSSGTIIGYINHTLTCTAGGWDEKK